MFRKIGLILLITMLMSSVLLAAGLVSLDWYLGTARFRDRLSKLVSETYGYEVTFRGGLGVSIYPWLGLETGPVEFRTAPDEEPLLRADQVSAKISLVRLLSHRLEFDTIFLNRIDVLVRREKDGSTNIDALLKLLLPQGEAIPVTDPAMRLESVTVRGVQLHHGHFRFVDELKNQTWTVEDADFQTGEFEPERPLPFSLAGSLTRSGLALAARLDMSGNLRTDLQAAALRLLDTRVNLILSGEDLPMQGKEAHFTSRLDFDSTTGKAELHDFHLKLPELMLAGDASFENLRDAPRAQGEIRSGVFSPRAAVNDFFPGTIPEKDPDIFKSGNFSLAFSIDENGLRITDLRALCDRTSVQGSFSLTDFVHPEYRFALKGDDLDFDRYYRIFIVDEPFYLDDFFPEFFLHARAEGTLDLDSVLLAGEPLENSRWIASCKDGALRINVGPAASRGGAFTAAFGADLAPGETSGYRLGLDLDVSMQGRKAADLPFIGRAGLTLGGSGSAHFQAHMPSMPFAGKDVVDDVLFSLQASAEYALEKATARTAPKDGSKARAVAMGTLRFDAALKPVGRNGKDGGYAFVLSGGARGADRDYSAWASYDGRLRMNGNYGGLALDDVRIKGRYEQGDLPAYAPALDFFVNGGLDVDGQRLLLSKVQAAGFGGDISATLEGHRIFEKDYTLTGRFDYDSDDPRGLLRWMTLKPGTPRGERAYSHVRVASRYSVTPYKAVFHHCEIGMDGATARGVIRIEDYKTGKLSFDLSADAVDIDQYRPAKRPRRDPKECVDPTQLHPIGLPVETLRDLNAEGILRCKDLLLYKLHFTDLKAVVRARDGQLTTSSLTGTFYGGKLEGAFTARSTKELIVLSLNLKAEDFRGGPFMADVGGREYVMGRSTIFLDVQSLGATDDDVIANLEGRGGFTVQDGSYRFSGKGGRETLRKGEQSILNNRSRFSGAGALFRIDHGGFYNEDFKMESAFMDLSGRGNFNIDTNIIDLSLEANYKAGPTVPLNIVGCLDDPAVEVPGGELITNTVRDLIGLPLKPFQYLRDLFF